MELSIDELIHNHIVHVAIDGTAHFSVREITETSVKLSDPKLGNIVMTERSSVKSSLAMHWLYLILTWKHQMNAK